MFGSTLGTGSSPAEFFKIDLMTGDYEVISTTSALNLQLAFGPDGTLYGHITGSGEFFIVDPSDGSTTLIGFIEDSRQFTDIASVAGPRGCDP